MQVCQWKQIKHEVNCYEHLLQYWLQLKANNKDIFLRQSKFFSLFDHVTEEFRSTDVFMHSLVRWCEKKPDF